MDSKESRTIKGLLILSGILTSNAIRFLSVRFVIASLVSRFFEMLRSLAEASRKMKVERLQSFVSFRVGSAGATVGIDLIVEIIFLTLALYVEAFTLPGALTAIATTALTSVNSGVITLFQVVIPLTAVIVTILLLITIVRRALKR